MPTTMSHRDLMPLAGVKIGIVYNWYWYENIGN